MRTEGMTKRDPFQRASFFRGAEFSASSSQI